MQTRLRAWLVLGLSLCFPVATACGPSAPPDHRVSPPGASGGSPGNPEACSPSDPSGSFAIAKTEPLLDDSSPSGPYRYRSVAIRGGGFVTGIEFSPIAKDVIFARTDVGGAYRWNGDHWMPVTDFLDRDNSNALGIESIAFDPTNPDVIYLAGGMYVTAGNGSILRTEDGGLHWAHYGIGVPMGGNADGRSMGERLAVDPNQPTTLYFGSRTLGLWRSTNSSSSWSRVASFPVTGAANMGLSFVLFDPKSGGNGGPSSTIYVGVADTTGPNLYRSSDAGETWFAVPGAPSGWMPHHALLDDEGALYIAYNDASGPNNVKRGAVYRHDRLSGGFRDISPPSGAGVGGLTLDRAHPGTLLASTLNWWAPDEIFRSTDRGSSWKALGECAQRDANGAQYLYFGGTQLSANGWMGDIELDPFNSGRALYITGQGIWWSDDVTSADSNRPTHWTFLNDGLEETVALDLAVPPAGAELLSAVGDIGGFRHDDLERPPESGMYENPVFGNTTSIDFAELAPEVVVRSGTTSRSRRGAYSVDGGSSWTPFATEPVNGRGEGTIAISADAERVLWSPRGAPPSYSIDRGQTWLPALGLETGARVAADRVDPLRFYALNADGTVFLSSDDGGETFVATATGLPRASGRPRAVFGNAGHVWLPASSGLHRSNDGGQTFERSLPVDFAYTVGFGKAAPGAQFPAVFLAGSVRSQRGIFRSDDGGESFVRIDDERRRFGYVNVIAGDPRRYGRVFLGTGGRGILYGDPLEATDAD